MQTPLALIAFAALCTPAHAIAAIAPAPGTLQTTVFTAEVEGSPVEDLVVVGPDFTSLVPASVNQTGVVGGVAGAAQANGSIDMTPASASFHIDATVSAEQPFISASASGSYVINFVLDEPTPIELFGSATVTGTEAGNGGAFNIGLDGIDPDQGNFFSFGTINGDDGDFAYSATLPAGSYFLFGVVLTDLGGVDPVFSTGSLDLKLTIPAPTSMAIPMVAALFGAARRRR